MTICFTLPYSSGGCEERRIKFDLLTAIIKCSLLASIKARGLMLTWLTLTQTTSCRRTSFFPSPDSFCHPFRRTHVCVCVSVCACLRACMRGRICVSVGLPGMEMQACLWAITFCILADRKRQMKWFPFLVWWNLVRWADLWGSCGIYYFPLSRLISKSGFHSDTITWFAYFVWRCDHGKQILKQLNIGDAFWLTLKGKKKKKATKIVKN